MNDYSFNGLLVGAATMFFVAASHAATFQLSVLENSAGDFSGTVDVDLIATNTVVAIFKNTSLLDGPVFESLHFERSVADWLSRPVWRNTDTAGNKNDDIVFKPASKLSGVPGGQSIDRVVRHRSGASPYKLDTSPPSPFNDLNSGELLQIEWGYTGDFDTYIADIYGGDPRLSVHIHDCFDGHSCSAVSSVPVPAAVWLFGSGLFGLVGVARRKKNRLCLS